MTGLSIRSGHKQVVVINGVVPLNCNLDIPQTIFAAVVVAKQISAIVVGKTTLELVVLKKKPLN